MVAPASALSAWEAAAVALALAYLVLIIRQNPLGWPAAIASAGIYTVLMFAAALYMQAALQLFYIGMAVYGWQCWQKGAGQPELKVTSWSWRRLLWPLGVILAGGAACGTLLAAHTDAALPYLDATVAVGAVVTTWLVARKVLQNWHFWFAIDAASVVLYAHQGLVLTAALFVTYLVLVVVGYRQWRAGLEAAGG